MDILVAKAVVGQWDGIGKGWDQGPLEHEKEICSSSSPIEVLQNQINGQKRENCEKRKSYENQGVTNLPPLK